MTRFKNIPRTCQECGGEIKDGRGTKYHLKCRAIVDRRYQNKHGHEERWRKDATVGSRKAYEKMITGHNK